MAKVQIKVQIERLPEGEYLLTSWDLPGLIVEGRTKRRAVQIAKDLARKIFESCREHGDPVPLVLTGLSLEDLDELRIPSAAENLSGYTHAEVSRKLRTFGFEFDREGAGSHEVWRQGTTGQEITLPHHAHDMVEDTLRAILREAGIDVDEFLKA